MIHAKRLPFLFFNLCFWLGSFHSLHAQTCTPIYHKTYNGSGDDEGLDISVTSDKGSIVAGRTTTNSPSWDGFLMHLDERGNILWAKSYGGSDYDELVRVKQTSDGGYVALGKTKSFGASAAWMIKTDADGNLLWSKQYSKGNEPVRAKDLIQLNDGGYVVAFNTNDSTNLGDGIVVRTDPSGNPLWSNVFDNGDDDGINSIKQDGNTLIIGGYATVNDREGILMRISLTDGSIIWSKRFARRLGLSDEILDVETTPYGLSFGASSNWTKSDHGFNPIYLTLFKTIGDDSIYSKRRIDVSTSSGTVIENLYLRATEDSSFIYAVSDTTPMGWPAFRKISPAGLLDWGRENTIGYGTRRLKSLDLFEDKGYVLTGYYKDFWSGNRSRIQVLKTDIAGKTGSCSGNISANFSDTTNYDISVFTWNHIISGVDQSDASPTVNLLNFTTNVLCSDDYCSDPDPAGNECFATLQTHIKGYDYTFTPYDFEKVADGYVLFGYNRLYWNVEPMMIRVNADGRIQWAKTLTGYIHQGSFDQVLKSSDGNLVVSGHDDVTIDHGGSSGDFVLKITPGGQVLWSENVAGDIYDMKPAENGDFIGTMTINYGFPPIYVTVFRMDPTGKITWQKQLNQNYDNHPIYRRIVYDGKYIYAAGEFYNQFPQNIAIEKIDMNGNHVWSKMFTVDGFATGVISMDMIGDSLYVMASVYDNSVNQYMSKKRIAAIKISKDGTGLNGFKLSDLDLVADNRTYAFMNLQTQIVTKTLDNNFVVADRVSDISDSSIVLTKFTPNGEVLWSKRYDHLKNHFISRVKDDNGSLLLLGRKFTGEVDFTYQFETLLMRTDKNGLIVESGTDDCHNVPVSVSVAPISFVEKQYSLTQSKDGTVQTTPFVPLERYFTMNSSVGCATVSDCSKIKIDGSQTVCNTTDTISYTLTRNAGCTIAPTWNYDLSAVKVVKQTDNSIEVVFKKGGQTFISATISSGCGVIRDSLVINVPTPAMPLDLGKDTTICSGTTILLNAHKGYLNYLWQNGSTDSAFKITDRGKYYVTVTDSCGKVFSDTILVTPHPVIPFSVGADRTKCNNDTIHIDAPSGFLNYSWSPSYNISSTTAQSIVMNPAKDTSYFVKAELTPGCFAYDTVRVKVNHSPAINLGNDTSFCSGKSVMLDAGAGFNRYRWSDASTQQTLSVNSPGTYSVVGTTVEGCSSLDTLKVVSVWPLPAISLDHNSELCQSSSRILDPGQFSSYRWQDGNTSRKYTVSAMGIYYVQVTDNNGCENADTVKITTILPSPYDFLPSDTSICSYGTAELAAVRSFASYIWSTGGTAPKLIVDKAGKYWLQVHDNKGCIGADTIVVNSKDCMVGLKLPNAFTPNHDAANDVFRALLFGKVKTFELTVYNRWGQIVFSTVDRYKGWDGTVAGKDQDPGVYIWTCKYQLEGDQEKMERGTVTLIR